jgi:hypothetical protein
MASAVRVCDSLFRVRQQSSNIYIERAAEAPIVRRLFASSPKDPRYHMLSHLSSKFSLGDDDQTHEPRAALFLNRFTRTLTVMYATSGIEQVIGISSENMKGRSFYYCIQENCLQDAVRCLESAKGNDSIAYMRFFFRDPRQADELDGATSESEDEIMTDITGSEDESELSAVGRDSNSSSGVETSGNSGPSNGEDSSNGLSSNLRTESGNNSGRSDGRDSVARSSTGSLPDGSVHSEAREEPIELEAVVSCTSDGLVVCLRRARPMIPGAVPQPPEPQQPAYPNGIFAAPWAQQPVFHPALPQPLPFPLGAQHPAMAQAAPSAFQNTLMQSIRDVAVFAWALVGINGSLADYAKGKPSGESQPPEGFPVWAHADSPFAQKLHHQDTGYVSGSSGSSRDPFGDPGR